MAKKNRGEITSTLALLSLLVITFGLIFGATNLSNIRKYLGRAAEGGLPSKKIPGQGTLEMTQIRKLPENEFLLKVKFTADSIGYKEIGYSRSPYMRPPSYRDYSVIFAKGFNSVGESKEASFVTLTDPTWACQPESEMVYIIVKGTGGGRFGELPIDLANYCPAATEIPPAPPPGTPTPTTFEPTGGLPPEEATPTPFSGEENICEVNENCQREAQYCKKPEGACGFDKIGFCAPRPVICTEQYEPVCGCDNQTYSNSCYAARAGVNVSKQDACKSANANLKFTPSSLTGNVGTTFDVKVDVDTAGDEILGVDARILYPANLVEIQSITDGTFLVIGDKDWAEPGKIYINGIVPDQATPAKGQGMLATITFRLKNEGSGKLTFVCVPGQTASDSNIVKNDRDATDIINCSSNGEASITVSGGTQPPPPRVTIVSPPPSAEACPFNPTAWLKDTQCNPVPDFNNNSCIYGTANDKWLEGVAVNPRKDACVTDGKRSAGQAGPRKGSTFEDRCSTPDKFSNPFDPASCKAEYRVRNDDLRKTPSYPNCCVQLSDQRDPATGQALEDPNYTYNVENEDRIGVRTFLGSQFKDPKSGENIMGNKIFDINSNTAWTIERQECTGFGCPEKTNLDPNSSNYGVINSPPEDKIVNIKATCGATQRYGWVLRKAGDTKPAKSSCSCGFYSTNYIKDADTGKLLTAFDKDMAYGTANSKRYSKQGADSKGKPYDSPSASFKNGTYCAPGTSGSFENCKQEVNINYVDTSEFAYRPGETASIKVYLGEKIGENTYRDKKGQLWEIAGQECLNYDRAGYKGIGCPQNTGPDGKIPLPSQNPDIISGINISCGTSVKYGWLVRKKTAKPTSPPGACRFRSTNYVRVVDANGNNISYKYVDVIGKNEAWGTANDKDIAKYGLKPQANFKFGPVELGGGIHSDADRFNYCKRGADGSWANCKQEHVVDNIPQTSSQGGYGRGDKATVSLIYKKDGLDGFTILYKDCEGVGCPQTLDLSEQMLDKMEGLAIDCGTDVSYGWIIIPNSELYITPPPITPHEATPTFTPTPTPTPVGPHEVGTVTLNLKLSFQGITPQLVQSGAITTDTLIVRVGLGDGGLVEPIYQYVPFTVDENAVWSGSVTFEDVLLGLPYKILTKGPKHLQRKICDAPPSPSDTVTPPHYRYRCEKGNIILNEGENDFDFTNIFQYAGDAPLPELIEAGTETGQDGVVNAFDVAALVEVFGQDDPESLNKVDFDYSGEVNALDYNIVTVTLSFQGDEL